MKLLPKKEMFKELFNNCNNFICPICKNELKEEYDSLKCNEGHTFDINKKGFCSLLKKQKNFSSAIYKKELFLNRRIVLEQLLYEEMYKYIANYINNGEREAGEANFDYAKLSDEEAKSAKDELVEIVKTIKEEGVIEEKESIISKNKIKILSLEQDQRSVEQERSKINTDINRCQANLSNAQRQLQNAQNQKVKVYREGVGWIYTSDQQAIASAQRLVRQYENQQYSLEAEQQQLYLKIQKIRTQISELRNENQQLEKEIVSLKNKYNF